MGLVEIDATCQQLECSKLKRFEFSLRSWENTGTTVRDFNLSEMEMVGSTC